MATTAEPIARPHRELSTSSVASSTRRPRRMFGVKDVFTTINALGGVVAICLCIEDQPYWAGVAMLLGYLLGDTIDGWVARKLGTANQFGAEYDTIADHLAHCIAPGAIVYTVYRSVDLGLPSWGSRAIAIALGGAIMITGSVRHARNVASPIHVQGVWAGLPRTVLGLLSVGFVNAKLAHLGAGWYWAGLVVVPALCVAALSYWPFPSHRMARPHTRAVRIAILAAFATTIAIAVVWPALVFDVILFWLLGYSLAGWLALTELERARWREAVRRALAGSP